MPAPIHSRHWNFPCSSALRETSSRKCLLKLLRTRSPTHSRRLQTPGVREPPPPPQLVTKDLRVVRQCRWAASTPKTVNHAAASVSKDAARIFGKAHPPNTYEVPNEPTAIRRRPAKRCKTLHASTRRVTWIPERGCRRVRLRVPPPLGICRRNDLTKDCRIRGQVLSPNATKMSFMNMSLITTPQYSFEPWRRISKAKTFLRACGFGMIVHAHVRVASLYPSMRHQAQCLILLPAVGGHEMFQQKRATSCFKAATASRQVLLQISFPP